MSARRFWDKVQSPLPRPRLSSLSPPWDQCARFTGIAPGEQSRGALKTIKIGIHTENTGINSYKTCAVNAAPRGAPWGSVGAPWGPVGPRGAPWGQKSMFNPLGPCFS